jgi:SET domain-containing protein
MTKRYLYLKRVYPKGRGVFTRESISANTIIEVAPVIVMNAQDRKILDKTLLHHYIFEWGVNIDKCCIALGLVSMYNHSYKSNCEYTMDYENEVIEIKTVKHIAKGQELTINYNGDCNNKKKVWFKAVE